MNFNFEIQILSEDHDNNGISSTPNVKMPTHLSKTRKQYVLPPLYVSISASHCRAGDCARASSIFLNCPLSLGCAIDPEDGLDVGNRMAEVIFKRMKLIVIFTIAADTSRPVTVV